MSKLRIFKHLLPPKKQFKGVGPRSRPADKKRAYWTRPTSPKSLGKRFLELAEMLRGQRRLRAALKEYKKAETYWKNYHPTLQNKMAVTLFSLKRHSKAIAPLLDSLTFYPQHFTTRYNLGRAYFHSHQLEKALRFFKMANQINPFHPHVHRYLAYIYRKKKQQKAYKHELSIQRILEQPDD